MLRVLRVIRLRQRRIISIIHVVPKRNKGKISHANFKWSAKGNTLKVLKELMQSRKQAGQSSASFWLGQSDY